MAPKAVSEVTIDLDPAIYEAQHVHAIYDTIASHFSSTRYKVMGHHLPIINSPDIIPVLAVAHYQQISLGAT